MIQGSHFGATYGSDFISHEGFVMCTTQFKLHFISDSGGNDYGYKVMWEVVVIISNIVEHMLYITLSMSMITYIFEIL